MNFWKFFVNNLTKPALTVSFYHVLHRVTLPPSYVGMTELFKDLMNRSVYCEAKLTRRRGALSQPRIFLAQKSALFNPSGDQIIMLTSNLVYFERFWFIWLSFHSFLFRWHLDFLFYFFWGSILLQSGTERGGECNYSGFNKSNLHAVRRGCFLFALDDIINSVNFIQLHIHVKRNIIAYIPPFDIIKFVVIIAWFCHRGKAHEDKRFISWYLSQVNAPFI